MTSLDSDLARQLTGRYNLHGVGLRRLDTAVNDVVAVSAEEGDFALKLYHRNRTPKAVEWEIDLLVHLHHRGGPVAQPIRGRNGYLEDLTVDGKQRIAVLSTWAPGAKPAPSDETYGLLGEAAARIHRAAEGFDTSPARERYDAAVLVDDQLQRMRRLLVQAGRWPTAVALGERLKGRLAEPSLDPRHLSHGPDP
jgi:Ser/Thr protein kinase RdoA (MazF antagonist)